MKTRLFLVSVLLTTSWLFGSASAEAKQLVPSEASPFFAASGHNTIAVVSRVTINNSASVFMYKVALPARSIHCWVTVYPRYGIQQNCLADLAMNALSAKVEKLVVIGKTKLDSVSNTTMYLVHDEADTTTCFVTLTLKQGLGQDCLSDLQFDFDVANTP